MAKNTYIQMETSEGREARALLLRFSEECFQGLPLLCTTSSSALSSHTLQVPFTAVCLNIRLQAEMQDFVAEWTFKVERKDSHRP